MTWTASAIALAFVKPLLAWAFFLPWTLLVPTSFGAAWTSEPSRRMALAAASFVAAGVAMYMLVPATESRYLLPLAAPVGILCGLAAVHFPDAGGTFRRRAVEVLTALVCVGVIVMSPISTTVDPASRLVLAAVALLTLFALGRPVMGKSAASTLGLLAAVALLSWLLQVRSSEPHRAGSRSLRAVAADFDAHLDPGTELWTAPVSKHFRHSSLIFYLRRPVRTYSSEAGMPAAGDYVVFFSDEHEELMAKAPFDYEIVEQRAQRRYEYVLARVRASGS